MQDIQSHLTEQTLEESNHKGQSMTGDESMVDGREQSLSPQNNNETPSNHSESDKENKQQKIAMEVDDEIDQTDREIER